MEFEISVTDLFTFVVRLLPLQSYVNFDILDCANVNFLASLAAHCTFQLELYFQWFTEDRRSREENENHVFLSSRVHATPWTILVNFLRSSRIISQLVTASYSEFLLLAQTTSSPRECKRDATTEKTKSVSLMLEIRSFRTKSRLLPHTACRSVE